MNIYKTFVQAFERFFWNLYSRIWDDYLNFPDFMENINNIVACLVKYQKSKDEKILDVGCGTGNYSIELAKNGFQVVGIDFSPGMINNANAKIQEITKNSVHFLQMDLNELSQFPNDDFDHVLCIHTFQNADNPKQFLQEMKRMIKSGGYLLVLIKDISTRKRKKTKLKLSFLKISINILKKLLSGIRQKPKFTKIELLSLLESVDITFVEECPFSGAVAILAQNVKN